MLAENDCYRPALALCLDGTGLGDDGAIWGGELLWMDLSEPAWKRLGRLSPFALPGGEAAIREPWRIALALRLQAGCGERPAPWDSEYASAAVAVREMLARGLNCPPTSSCGRLFDAVAAQLGLCSATTYEGQAAIRLEAATDEAALRDNVVWSLPPLEKNGLLELDSAALFGHVLQAQAAGEPAERIAACFHGTLASALAAMAAEAARTTGARQVGLSGGVMQNALLARLLPRALAERGLSPLMHHELPPGCRWVRLSGDDNCCAGVIDAPPARGYALHHISLNILQESHL